MGGVLGDNQSPAAGDGVAPGDHAANGDAVSGGDPAFGGDEATAGGDDATAGDAAPADVCPDGDCTGSESCATCPQDCGVCPTGTVYYVDDRITPATCADYDVGARACGAGTETAFRAFSGATAVAGAGATVLVRGGTFAESLVVTGSGAPGSPVTYAAYPGETVVISAPTLRPAIDISNREYLIIDGFEVTDVMRWLYVPYGHHNVIRNNTFRRATDASGGSKTGLFFLDATYNAVVNNVIDDNPADSLSLVNSDHNLVAGNTFTRASHALWDIRCGDFNIIRDNYFHNEIQKIGEIYDCDGVAERVDYDATKRNVVDRNEFAYVPSSGDQSAYSGIQFAGQQTIIRRNVFHDTVGPGIRMALYGQEARHNTDNRLYNNVFYGTDFAGIEIAEGGAGYTMSGNIMKNNSLAGSVFVANDTRWSWWNTEVQGKPVQVKTSRLDGFLFDTNHIYTGEVGEAWSITYGWRSPGMTPQQNVEWWEDNHPELVRNTVEADPKFENAADAELTPLAGSPLINAGAFLTTVVGPGQGDTLVVADAGYFHDGFGIPNEPGDTIQLEGSTETAVILSVDYSQNELTLDESLTFSDGQGVSLPYLGSRPDIGAIEVE